MLQKFIAFVLLLTPAIAGFSQNISYTIKGKIDNKDLNGNTIYLQKINNEFDNLIMLDSTKIENSGFSFTESFDEKRATLRRLFVALGNDEERQYIFMPENGEISISIQGSGTYSLKGTPINEDISLFEKEQHAIQGQLTSILNKYSTLERSPDNTQKRIDEVTPFINQLKDNVYMLAKKNIKNPFGEFLTISLNELLTPDQAIGLITSAHPEFQAISAVAYILNIKKAEELKKGGAKYKDITLKSPEGKDVSLSDYIGKNKVVLVDFWASWCGPCRKEIPHLVKLYEKYKDKGFEIVGVSLDENATTWVKTIEKFGITWPQISDLKGWKSEAAMLYGITSIPFTLLIDEKGIVIESSLYGNDLENKLKELLD